MSGTVARGSSEDTRQGERLRRAAAAAYAKEDSGQPLSRTDENTIARWEKYADQESWERVSRSLTLDQLCAVLDSSRKVLTEWRDAGMPVETFGRTPRYDLFKVVPWVKRRLMKAPMSEAEKLGTDARARREWARAEYEETRLRKEKGELTSAAAVRQELVQLAIRVRNEVLSVPAKVAARCEGKSAVEIQAEVESHLRDALGGLADAHGEVQGGEPGPQMTPISADEGPGQGQGPEPGQEPGAIEPRGSLTRTLGSSSGTAGKSRRKGKGKRKGRVKVQSKVKDKGRGAGKGKRGRGTEGRAGQGRQAD